MNIYEEIFHGREGAGRTAASRAKVTEKTKETCMEIITRVMRRRVAQMSQ